MVKIGIVGGGAGGMFAAISLAENAASLKSLFQIEVLEASTRFLTKVGISGGGRCNVTYFEKDPRKFSKNYPRGEKELISSLYRFGSEETMAWFKSKGVDLKVEQDFRVFPKTDRSSTIVNCLLSTAREKGVVLTEQFSVSEVLRSEKRFQISDRQGNLRQYDLLVLGTGSSPVGYKISKSLGHTIEELAPSLFAFDIEHPLLPGLSGISFSRAVVELEIPNQPRFRQEGPILITHRGLSGPAILKLSAWAARDMKGANYRAKLLVNWSGCKTRDELKSILVEIRDTKPRAMVANAYPQSIPSRFWERILEISEVPRDLLWGQMSKKNLEKIIEMLFRSELQISGKSRNKEEFVECGGVSRNEIHWKTMESLVVPNLYYVGEIIDVDGITGGFNLQHAWTSGWLAGMAMAEKIKTTSRVDSPT